MSPSRFFGPGEVEQNRDVGHLLMIQNHHGVFLFRDNVAAELNLGTIDVLGIERTSAPTSSWP